MTVEAPGPALVGWAQEHFLHGHLLTPWITDYVDLEVSLSVGSIAQEELAHASLLLEVAGLDDEGRDDMVYAWPVERWTPSALMREPVCGWPATVVRGLLLSTAAVVRTGWLLDDPAGRDAAEVLLAEQELHVVHWSHWARRLATDTRTAAELTATTTALLPLADDLLDAVPVDGVARQRLRDTWWSGVRAVVPGAEPAASGRAGSAAGLAGILAEVRTLRTTPDDGVLGRYR